MRDRLLTYLIIVSLADEGVLLQFDGENVTVVDEMNPVVASILQNSQQSEVASSKFQMKFNFFSK